MSPLAKCLVALALCGCVAKLDDATTPESLAASGKAGIVFRMGFVAENCHHSTITLAKKSGDAYVQAANLVQRETHDSSAVIHVELDPGEYHVVSWTCTVGSTTQVLGKGSFGRYAKSMAHFEVRAGEIVNLGALNMIMVAPKRAYLAVSDLPARMQEWFRLNYPNLALRVQTRLLTVTMPELPPRQRAAFCARIANFHQKWKLPPHPMCALLPPSPVAEMDPGGRRCAPGPSGVAAQGGAC